MTLVIQKFSGNSNLGFQKAPGWKILGQSKFCDSPLFSCAKGLTSSGETSLNLCKSLSNENDSLKV